MKPNRHIGIVKLSEIRAISCRNWPVAEPRINNLRPIQCPLHYSRTINLTVPPKGIKNLATDLKEELEEKITITENGTLLEITKQRAMFKTLMAKALKGDSRASSVLIGLAISMEQADSSQHTVHVFPEEDLAIIENLKARLKDTSDQPLSEENNDETDSE